MLEEARLAILPGDPARVPRISAYLDEPTPLAAQREFTSHLGRIDGTPVVVCSTGIGGPSTSVAVEELAQLGVRTFLRIGTTGSIQPDVVAGTIIVTQAAVRLDGASFHFAPAEYPAASSFECTKALAEAAEELGVDHRVGITASSDTFYPGQERYDTVAGDVARRFKGSARRVASAERTELRDGGGDTVHYVFRERLAGRLCRRCDRQPGARGDPNR